MILLLYYYLTSERPKYKCEPGGVLLSRRGSDREGERPGGRPLNRGGMVRPPRAFIVGHPAALAQPGSNAYVVRKSHRCASTNVRSNTFTRHGSGGGVVAIAGWSARARCSFVRSVLPLSGYLSFLLSLSFALKSAEMKAAVGN